MVPTGVSNSVDSPGLSEDAKIGLGTGLGVPIGLLVLPWLGRLLYKVITRPENQSIYEAVKRELAHWRRLIWSRYGEDA